MAGISGVNAFSIPTRTMTGQEMTIIMEIIIARFKEIARGEVTPTILIIKTTMVAMEEVKKMAQIQSPIIAMTGIV